MAKQTFLNKVFQKLNEEENNMHLCVLAVTYSSPRAPHLQGELGKDEKIGSDVNS